MQAPQKMTYYLPPPIYCHNFVAPPEYQQRPPPKTQATSRSKAKHQFTTPRVGLGIVEPQEKHVQYCSIMNIKASNLQDYVSSLLACSMGKMYDFWIFLVRCKDFREQRYCSCTSISFYKMMSASAVSASKSCTQVPRCFQRGSTHARTVRENPLSAQLVEAIFQK